MITLRTGDENDGVSLDGRRRLYAQMSQLPQGGEEAGVSWRQRWFIEGNKKGNNKGT
jgi:hypothetical protein